MPLFGKSNAYSENPEIRQVEKAIAKEARDEQKSLERTMKNFSGAEKSHNKSVKATARAHNAVEKAVEDEYDAAKALNRATHNHETAISNEQNAEKTVQLKQQHEDRLEQDLAQKRTHLDEQQERKAQNDHTRELRLAQVHADAAVSAETRRASFGSNDERSSLAHTAVDDAAHVAEPKAVSPSDALPGAGGVHSETVRPGNTGVYDSSADFDAFV